MLMLSSIFLLLSNAINSQREASILNSRIAIVTLMYPIWFLYNQTIYLFLNPGIALFNGLFYINSYTVTFCFFLFNLSVCILCLTGFLHIRVYPSVSYKSYNEFTNEYKAKFMHFYEKTSWYIHSLWYHKNYIEESFRWPSSNSLKPELLEKPYSHNTNLLNLDAIPYRLAEVHGVRYNDGVNRENTMVYVSEVQQEMPSISEANAIAQDKLKANQMYNITEYPLIIVFVITGSVFLMSSSDLLSVFLSVELQSYGLYLLSSSFRNSETATGGGLTYFLLGGLSSTFILLGASFIYANCGNTLLENLYIISDLTPSVHQQTMINNGNSVVHGETLEGRYDMWYNSYYLHLSLVMAGVGFLFKVSAAPFHFWSPDVYDAIPTVVTTFVAIIAKISIFIFLLDLVYYTSKTLQSVNFNWTIILLISSFLSLIIGSVLGLTQHRIKRLYAYSTISHVGFILLALAVCSVESIQSYFFYIMQYSLSNLNAFFLLLVIGYTLTSYEVTPHNDAFSGYKTPQIKDNSVINAVAHEPSGITETNEELLDKDNSPLQLIKQLKGYSSVNPMIAVSLIVTLFSFIGVPPLLGFFAKQMVLSAALDKGYFFVVLIAILTSVISAVYYLSVVKNIFFDTVTSKPLGQDKDQRSNKSGKANTTETNSYTSKGFLTHFFFIISLKHSTRYIGDFPIYEVDSDTRNALTLWDTSFNIDDIILTKGNRHKFGNEFAKDYQFSAYSIEYNTQPTGPLNILISFLSLLILLFMFTPVEWLNLSSILSLSLFYF